ANYRSAGIEDGEAGQDYDVSETSGYHPSFDDGVEPFTSPVGSFAPNGYGLYDMVGNMWEWCWDLYGDYPSSAVTDPHGPASGTLRVVRGGSWLNFAFSCRAAYRYNYYPGNSGFSLGFRFARSSVP
ncbi:MAG: formylglycine-generating enzyme family protein, partial [Verrucomicrobiales bacterium]